MKDRITRNGCTWKPRPKTAVWCPPPAPSSVANRASCVSTDRNVEAAAEGVLFLMNNVDKPGMVGYIGSLMGEHQVNIANMSLNRDEEGGEALMLLNLDHAPSSLTGQRGPRFRDHQRKGDFALIRFKIES